MRAFIFPGQGAQYVGMGKALAEQFEVAKNTFAEANEALGMDLTQLVFEGPLETLTETENNQPAILSTSVAYYRVLREKGHDAGIVAGHSLGEYSALVAAEALSFADAVRLVRARGKYMQEAVPLGVGTMAAIVGPKAPDVEGWCEKATEGESVVEPAGYNCPGQTVVAGHVEAVDRLIALAEAEGARAIKLQVSAPFHSSPLTPAGENLAGELDKVEVRTPRIPYVPNVTAEPTSSADDIKRLLIEQVSKPVRWEASVRAMMEAGVEEFLEVGPGKTLLGFCRKIERRFPAATVDNEKTWGELIG